MNTIGLCICVCVFWGVCINGFWMCVYLCMFWGVFGCAWESVYDCNLNFGCLCAFWGACVFMCSYMCSWVMCVRLCMCVCVFWCVCGHMCIQPMIDHRAVLTMWKHVELDTYNLCTPLYHLFFNNVVHLKIYRLRHHKLEGPLDSDEENGVLCLPYHEFTSENQLTYVGFWISMGKKKNDLNQVILIFLPTPGVSNPLTEVSGFLHFKNQY